MCNSFKHVETFTNFSATCILWAIIPLRCEYMHIPTIVIAHTARLFNPRICISDLIAKRDYFLITLILLCMCNSYKHVDMLTNLSATCILWAIIPLRCE